MHTGLVLYSLAPCIAVVIIVTYLAKGNTPVALVVVAFNSIIEMILIPVYASLLISAVQFNVPRSQRRRRAASRMVSRRRRGRDS